MALVAFDLNGTLLDPGEHSGQLQRAVRLAMAHTLADDIRPFDELMVAAGGASPEAMPCFADVPGALRRLASDHHRLAVVTNSARATAERQLQHAGLLDAFERVIGTDEVGAFKPSRLVYAHALTQLGVLAEEAWFVAAHDWDLVGAHAAGLHTVFVDRGGPPPVTITVDRTVADLSELTV
jgi:2-haloacid dehalogenase